MKSKQLQNWENETEELCQYFHDRYFGKNADIWWVSESIGGVLVIADYFFSLNDVVDFIRYSYSKKEMFNYYNYRLEYPDHDKPCVCIRDWRKLKK